MEYQENQRYTRKLAIVEEYGDARQRVVILKDDEECKLIWVTRDSSNIYQYFKSRRLYSFKVHRIFCDKIFISNMIRQAGVLD
ncbi:hypothetical protein [Desulfosporosinus sp. FKA]|uniref:hypothetical protein n=1 Tax=Desulfosporosinus sp. FKA TaxID=1969834 RepID=UPI000B49CEA8|nr:hypothetical protein [Desulfosporosinus sp. FKA]